MLAVSSAELLPRVVVTGATGFIGSHLLRRLRQAGYPALAIVRTESAAGGLQQGIDVVARDLERVDSLEDVLRPGDVVVHLAARVHMMRDRGTATRDAYRSANLIPTRMLCRSAAERGVRQVIFLSSGKVFGEGRDAPYTRDDAPAPSDAYAESKVEAENAVREQAGQDRFDWTILRPPFVYGPGGKGNFPRLVSLAHLSTLVPLPLGSIGNRRSVIFVGNLVDVIVRSIAHPGSRRRVLLPTDAHDVSTAELVRAIAGARGDRARLFACPSPVLRAAARLVGRSAEMDRLTESLRLDSRHLREELDWAPPFTLRSALARSVPAGSKPRGGASDA